VTLGPQPFAMRGLALLLVALLAACAPPGGDGFDYASCGVRPRLAIPVRMQGDVPLIQATVKGTPATFVLDTGSVSVALTQNALIRFGLATDPKVMVTAAGVGGTSRTSAGRLEDLRIGDLPVPDHHVSVLPASSGISDIGIDGLFGASILSVFELDLDLPRRTVTLYAGRLCAGTAAPPWIANAVTIPATRSGSGRFFIPAVLDGRPVNALLDTGASVSMLSADIAASLGATPAVLAADRQATLAGTGPSLVKAAVHRFGRLVLAGQTYTNPVFVVAQRPDPSVDMIIGADWLAHHRLWLSYARKLVFVERP
jgi:predicted aspartyl protease